MTTISQKIAVGSLNLLGGIKLQPVKLSSAEIERADELWKQQFLIPLTKPDNHPDNIYATVKKDGKVVGTLYNSGAAMTPNAMAGKTSKLSSFSEKETLVGPALAQKRAEELAKAVGGTIEMASTAQKPGQWKPTEHQWTYDYAAMDAAAKTRFDTQRIAQEKTAEPEDAVIAKFLDFMDSAGEGFASFMRAQMLASKGLTEEQFAQLSPEEQETINQEIKEAIDKAVREAAEKRALESAVNAQT